jgi:hypothetical protein
MREKRESLFSIVLLHAGKVNTISLPFPEVFTLYVEEGADLIICRTPMSIGY